MALGGHDSLNDLWPTRWAERFEACWGQRWLRPDYEPERLAWFLALRLFGEPRASTAHPSLLHILSRCESPIERAFLATAFREWSTDCSLSVWLGPRARDAGFKMRFVALHSGRASTHAHKQIPHDGLTGQRRQDRVIVYPQLRIRPYRCDAFVVFERRDDDGPAECRRSMVIECDGHDFHEKTKEQASADKARDRYLQARGHLVFRFSGADIWNDAYACVREALSALRAPYQGKG